MEKTKPYTISKRLFVEAYRKVKANAGGAGVDQQSLKDFERDLENNLYKLWNRMSSGSYFPPAVKAVPIPKKSGGERILGVPTVGDRICQMVVKQVFEPAVEKHFMPDSYGYRPQKSALDAIGVTRQRCWRYDWVLEYDIKGLFDNIPHEKLMKAVCKHTQEKWVRLYIERWLKAPIQQSDGKEVVRSCGTPQGGVISPVLSNLYLHYVNDVWMDRHYPSTPWCRYADDGLVHCKTEQEAQKMLAVLTERYASCGLTLHPEKTKIVYCKDDGRKGKYENISFDFLGYTFRARGCRSAKGVTFSGFTPAVSKSSLNSMRATIREDKLHRRAELSLEQIAKWYNPKLQGWLNYYGKYHVSELYKLWRCFNKKLVSWAMRKYRRLKGRKIRACIQMRKVAKERPGMFVHWRNGMIGAFV